VLRREEDAAGLVLIARPILIACPAGVPGRAPVV
jgi:hypothetical protein